MLSEKISRCMLSGKISGWMLSEKISGCMLSAVQRIKIFGYKNGTVI